MLISDYKFMSVDLYFGFWLRGSGSAGSFRFGFAHVDENEEKINLANKFSVSNSLLNSNMYTNGT